MLRRFLVLGAMAVMAFVGLPAISGCDSGGGVKVDEDLMNNAQENETAATKRAQMESQGLVPKGAGENK